MKQSPEVRMTMAGLLNWILPGSGHLFIGEKARGITIMVTIALAFWMGIAVGGVKNTVNQQQRGLWFMGQICTGGHALTAMVWSSFLPDADERPELLSFVDEEEIAVVYTAICGMLNILVIFDVITRAEKPWRRKRMLGDATV